MVSKRSLIDSLRAFIKKIETTNDHFELVMLEMDLYEIQDQFNTYVRGKITYDKKSKGTKDTIPEE